MKHFIYYQYKDGTREYVYMDGKELTYDAAIDTLMLLIKKVQSHFWGEGFDVPPTVIHESLKASIPAYGIIHRALGQEVQHDEYAGED